MTTGFFPFESCSESFSRIESFVRNRCFQLANDKLDQPFVGNRYVEDIHPSPNSWCKSAKVSGNRLQGHVNCFIDFKYCEKTRTCGASGESKEYCA